MCAYRWQHLEGLPAGLGDAQVAVHGIAEAALRHAVEAPVGVPGNSCSLAVAAGGPTEKFAASAPGGALQAQYHLSPQGLMCNKYMFHPL